MSSIENSEAIAAALRQIGRGYLELADAIVGNITGSTDLDAREVAALREFPVSREHGLTRHRASAVFKKHGLEPRAIGAWVRHGYLERQGDLRWLGAKGRERLEQAERRSS
jgi:hypothetical protein